MTLDTTLAAIKAIAPTDEPGGLLLRPDFDPLRPGLEAYWQRASGASHSSWGDNEAAGLDNLLLVMQGRGDEVDRALRLQVAQATEAERQAALDAAVAEREAIEAESP